MVGAARVLCEVHLVSFLQEVGVGFNIASETELANRRYVHTSSRAQVSTKYYLRVKALPKRASLGVGVTSQPTNSEQLVRA